MTTPFIPSINALIQKHFGTPELPMSGGAEIIYSKDKEGTITSISLELNNIKALCCLEPFDYEGADLHLAKCRFYFSKLERNIGFINANFCCLNRNDSNALTSYGLKNEDFSKLLFLVINRLNNSIDSQQGLTNISSKFLNGNFDIIHDYIRNTCLTTLYSLINPKHLPTGVDLNSYIPTQEEYNELHIVVRLYTELIGKLLTHLLVVTQPSWNGQIKGIKSGNNFIWLELSK